MFNPFCERAIWSTSSTELGFVFMFKFLTMHSTKRLCAMGQILILWMFNLMFYHERTFQELYTNFCSSFIWNFTICVVIHFIDFQFMRDSSGITDIMSCDFCTYQLTNPNLMFFTLKFSGGCNIYPQFISKFSGLLSYAFWHFLWGTNFSPVPVTVIVPVFIFWQPVNIPKHLDDTRIALTQE